jgi:hypothetical protein
VSIKVSGLGSDISGSQTTNMLDTDDNRATNALFLPESKLYITAKRHKKQKKGFKSLIFNELQ